MDHEVIPQICDLVVELVQGPLHFYIKDKYKSDHGGGGLQKDLFSSLHHPLSWSNKFGNERGKRGTLVVKVGDNDKEMLF